MDYRYTLTIFLMWNKGDVGRSCQTISASLYVLLLTLLAPHLLTFKVAFGTCEAIVFNDDAMEAAAASPPLS